MKKILQINILLMMLFMFMTPIHALSDGAYLVSRSTSYTNPLTGQTEDGGENIALGESMVSNIVESQLLVEQTNGKYYKWRLILEESFDCYKFLFPLLPRKYLV